MKPILEIQNISKIFRIQHEKQSYLNLRDSISNIFKSKKNNREEFFALNNVSFNVFSGESIGIIGKNGAGKSTLLKILSKITPPTSGKIISRGRIASLLEVGTGFHGELSGRENVFLNGSILGMKRSEIQKNFDAIVDFSGVEKFLDTPLKHYSSGMQLRLAFAVAAFLEPEILIIDEVLAVGDSEFQKKCLGKMQDISMNQGRTVLFVSHNLAVVKNLCQKSALLVEGKLQSFQTTDKIINLYLQDKSINRNLSERNDRKGSGEIKIRSIEILDINNNPIESVHCGQSFQLIFNYEIVNDINHLDFFTFGVAIKTDMEIIIFSHHNRLNGMEYTRNELIQNIAFSVLVKNIPVSAGIYNLDYSLIYNKVQYVDGLSNAIKIEIIDGQIYNNICNPPTSHGFCLVDAIWSLKN